MKESIMKKLPVGIEKFRKICTEGFYYIDKTGFIKELLDSWGADASLFEGVQISEEFIRRQH